MEGLLDDTVRQAQMAYGEAHGGWVDPNAGLWREDPVAFEDFVTSIEHLNLPKLFPRQLEATLAVLGPDPKRIFETPAAAEPQPLPWTKVPGSTNVRQFAYIAGDQVLHVEFKDRTVYRYVGVLPVEAIGLAQAKSKGSFIAQIIKPRYPADRLDLSADELVMYVRDPSQRAYQLAVLLWGKGSGKDYLCSIIVTYLVYVLMCLNDPQGYLELAPGENIDLINVAYNSDQAKKVFFAKFKERLKRWGWLRKNYDVYEGGARLWKGNAGLPKVQINDVDVEFPSKIRCFSRHSQNESYEGLNVIAWIMDEASAFLSAAKRENAEKIYGTLRSSAGSRFGQRWLGFVISYPRHADDFTMTKVAEARAQPSAGIYADGPAKTWEVNQLRGRQGFVEVRPGHKVPVELANDYILDFEEALAKYEAQPPLARDALIKDPDRVWAAVQKGRQPLIQWEPRVTKRDTIDGDGNVIPREFAAVKLTRLGKLPPRAKLFMHGDPARTSDGFGLAIGHGAPATILVQVPAGEVLTRAQLRRERLEPETLVPWERDVVRTVIDAVLVWRPDPSRNRHVDLLNVREIMLAIIKHYGIGAWGGITFDQYDSAETVQTLETMKLPVENESWSNPLQHRIYRGARSMFYNDLVTLPDTPTITSTDARQPGAIYELLRVEEIEGHKIDHPEGGSKDLADAVVRVIEHVSGQSRRAFSYGTVGAGQSVGDRGHTPVPGKTINPQSTPALATPAARAEQAARARERPLGEIHQGTGEEIPAKSRFSFGSVRR